MLTFLSAFLLFNCIYQIFSTIIIYGLGIFSASMPSLIRDGMRCVFLLILLIINRHSLKSYLKKRKKIRISFIVLLLYSVLLSYLFFNKAPADLLIGIKYGFWRIFILLSSTFIGFIYHKKLDQNASKYTNTIERALLIVVILGFLRQVLKLLKPERFAAMGYTIHLNDYYFGDNPPIYYLTGYEGTLRRQGLFSGPNNYGYFLLAFFPWVLPRLHTSEGKTTTTKFTPRRIITLILRLLAMALTLSRAVFLGAIFIILLTYRPLIKSKKKLIICTAVTLIAGVIALSLLKRESTLAHITSKLSALPEIFTHPRGMGLGSSWPAIHHNGSILPENYYFQILLDVGRIGFGLWYLTIFPIIRRRPLKNHENLAAYKKATLGFLSLLAIGLFLHVFEDSMVNYLFFIIYGIILWYLSKKEK